MFSLNSDYLQDYVQDVSCDAQGETWLCVCVSCRHERIHTKRGGHMKTQTDADEVEDLATLEVLDEVRRSIAKQ